MDMIARLKQVGDIYVSAVKKTVDLGFQSAKGVVLTFDINRLCMRKNTISRVAGDRMKVLIKEGVTDVNRDDKLADLISELKKIEQNLEELKGERAETSNALKLGKRSELLNK